MNRRKHREQAWPIRRPHSNLNVIVTYSVQRLPQYIVSSPDPTYERGSCDIRLIPRASLTLITFWREILSTITLQTICSATLATSARWHSTQLSVLNYAYSKLWILMKPKESAGCHQTLFSHVGSGNETNLSIEYHRVGNFCGENFANFHKTSKFANLKVFSLKSFPLYSCKEKQNKTSLHTVKFWLLPSGVHVRQQCIVRGWGWGLD